MKKILFFFLLFSYSLSYAQIGDGYDFAMNFGGGGASVKELVIAPNGDTYFVVNIIGRAVFDGQQIDGGIYGSSPLTKTIYGKINTTGTQTLLKVLPTNLIGSALDADGNLFATFIGNAGQTFDFGNGITDNSWGFKMVKISNTGVAQWKKDINTGASVPYGNAVANPDINGLQITPDGSIYMAIDANNIADNPGPGNLKYVHRLAKYTSSGDEVWHNDIFSESVFTSLSIPEQFVSNDGRMAFGVIWNTNQFYFNGENIGSQMSTYLNGYYTFVATLNADGTKNTVISDNVGLTYLKGVDPVNGDVYVTYQTSTLFNNTIKSTKAPYSTLPNRKLETYAATTYMFGGLLVLNQDGTMKRYGIDNYTISLNTLLITPSRVLTNEKLSLNAIVDKGGDYVFYGTEKSDIFSFYDKDLNFQKAKKTPETEVYHILGDKFSFGGNFKGTLTFGNTTLTQSFNDTDFATRFPAWASTKADIFIAKADTANISSPAAANWLGVDNNWNNAANWSTGKVPDAGTIVKFNLTTANMPATATSPTALKVIVDAGVVASIPSNTVIKSKLFINGTLQVNHTGTLFFSAYSSTGIEGVGSLAFNGTSNPSVIMSVAGSKDLTVETNENMTIAGKWKKINFTGTNSIVTASGTGIELTSSASDAISGASETNFIVGKVTRAISSSGTFTFPISTASNVKPEPVTLTTNNLNGVSKLTVGTSSSPSTPNVYFPSGTTTAVLGAHFWTVTPDADVTSGTYDINLTKYNFTNGVTDPDRYVIIKRIDSNNPWTFEGTKTASTQTGGTVNNNIVSNAAVTAGLTGLSKFSDFVIGINSVAVANNTTVTTSTWTGAVNTTWANAGNWSNGIPNSTVEAVIPSGLTNYPLIYSTTDNARSLTIESGITGLKLHGGLILSNGLINHSTIEIAKLANMSDFKGYGGGVNGSGKLVFTNSGLFTRIAGGVYNNDIEINVGSTTVFYASGKFSGNFDVITGKVVGYFVSPTYFEQVNPNSTLTIAAPANLIGGEVYKNVNTTGTYTFPIGDDLQIRNSVVKYGEIAITNNNITSSTIYKVKFDYGVTEAVSITNGSDVYTSFINSGQWYITPTTNATTGTIDVSLKTTGYTNGRVSTSDYVLLRRNAVSYNPATPWTIVNGATINENAGVITVTATNLAPFSSGTMFCIGLKATTTTWTGTTSTNWNTASNWTNGIPSSTVKAVIANAAQYPSNPPTSGTAAAAIEISSGSTLTLPSTFYTSSGIINNGTINISGSGTFYGFGSGTSFSSISGGGKIVFDNNSPATFDSYYMSQTLNNGIEINKTGGITLTRTTTFNGDVSLINGLVTPGSGQIFFMNNPTATLTSTANSYINGELKRTVNASGNYNFPVGNLSNYAPAVLNLNSIVGPTTIQASFSNAAVSGNPNLTIGNASVNSVLAAGTWKITPNTSMTDGSYNVSLSASVGSSSATSFYVLKREDNYSFYNWANLGTNQPWSVNDGVVTASATGITGFSQFGIGEGMTTLPVDLINFYAKAYDKSVLLSWETLTELNNEMFIIERADDNGLFVNIGEVKGKGNATSKTVYNYKDINPLKGNNYYRLKQVDANGTYKFSEVRVLNFNINSSNIIIYPNPVTDVINFTNSDMIKTVNIYDTSGNLKPTSSQQVSSIPVSQTLNQGLYVIQLKLTNGETKTEMIYIKR